MVSKRTQPWLELVEMSMRPSAAAGRETMANGDWSYGSKTGKKLVAPWATADSAWSLHGREKPDSSSLLPEKR